MGNNGTVRITLSDESANALCRVTEMKQWEVAPTMVRGAKKATATGMTAEIEVTKPVRKRRFAHRVRFMRIRKNQTKGADGKHSETQGGFKKTKKRILKKSPERNEKEVFGVENTQEIKRSASGRSIIKAMLHELKVLDAAAFAQAPAFDTDGVCRMKHDSAKGRTWQDIREGGPPCIEVMCSDIAFRWFLNVFDGYIWIHMATS